MQELKSFDSESIPDLGQKYWMHVGRMERCKGWSFWRTFLVAGACAIMTAILVVMCLWLFNYQPGSSAVRAFFSLSAIGAIVGGFASIVVVAIGASDALQQRRWRKEMPSCPANYHPKMAEAAHRHKWNVIYFNERLKKAQTEADALPKHAEGIRAELARLSAFQAAMAEDDLETFTLRS